MNERQPAAYEEFVESLTPREFDVLFLLSQHLRYQDIANQLSLAITSVKWYAQQIYRKLGVDNRRDAVERARQLGILKKGQFSQPPPDGHKVPTHLPRPLNRFIGREKQIAEVSALIIQNPLVTLTGSGGVGKTRLVQVVAGEVGPIYQHGVCIVELAPLADPNLLAQTVATALELQKTGDRSYLEILIHSLRDKQVLLIFDNCEHLLPSCSLLAEALLKHCPQLSLLATSREALGIHGELVYRVPSMTAPDPGAYPDPILLEQSEAIQLFADRAASIQPGFLLSPETVPLAAEICHRLDGIPLAIELAAALVNAISLEQIASRLDDRFRLLTGGSRTALPRHKTLRASIDWSYSLLTEKERILLRRLSVFAGGWTLEAAEGVCAASGLDQGELLDGLVSLVNKSLVVASSEPETTRRYRMLETIRQFAGEKLDEAGEGVVLREAHLQFFLALALEDGPKLKTDRIVEVLHVLERELDNLRAALNWAIQRGDQFSLKNALQLICSLHYLWATRALYWETFPRLIDILEKISTDAPQSMALRAWGYYTLSALQADFNIEVETIGYLNQCVSLYRHLQNQPGLAMALALRSYLIFRHHGFYPPHPAMSLDEAERQQAESFALADELALNTDLEAQSAAAWVYCWNGAGEVFHMENLNAQKLGVRVQEWFSKLGDAIGEQYGMLIYLVASIMRRDMDGLIPQVERAIESAKRIGHKRFLSFFVDQRVSVQLSLRQYSGMVVDAHQGLILQRQLGSMLGEAENYRYLGIAYTHLQKYSLALGYLQEGLHLLSEVMEFKDPFHIVEILVAVAGVAVRTGRSGQAAQLVGTIEAQMEIFQRPMSSEIAEEFINWKDQVQELMDECEYQSMVQQGRALSMEQAVPLALQLTV